MKLGLVGVGGGSAYHWMDVESNYPALPLGRFSAFRSFPPLEIAPQCFHGSGDQGLVRMSEKLYKSEPQSLVPKRKISGCTKGFRHIRGSVCVQGGCDHVRK